MNGLIVRKHLINELQDAAR